MTIETYVRIDDIDRFGLHETIGNGPNNNDNNSVLSAFALRLESPCFRLPSRIVFSQEWRFWEKGDVFFMQIRIPAIFFVFFFLASSMVFAGKKEVIRNIVENGLRVISGQTELNQEEMRKKNADLWANFNAKYEDKVTRQRAFFFSRKAAKAGIDLFDGKEFEKAGPILREKVQEKNSVAEYYLGRLLMEKYPHSFKFGEGKELLINSAQKGFPPAQYHLGIYFKNRNQTGDREEALFWFTIGESCLDYLDYYGASLLPVYEQEIRLIKLEKQTMESAISVDERKKIRKRVETWQPKPF